MEGLQDYYQGNYSTNYIPDSLAEPCHSLYCSVFGSSIPVFLAVTSTLGLLGKLALGIALAKRPHLWRRRQPSKTTLVLMTVASVVFAALLPFFAAGFLRRWVFGDRFCQAAQTLRYGCLFAQGLVVVVGSARQNPARCSGFLWHTILWAGGFVLATPVSKISHTGAVGGTVCVLRSEPEIYLWSLAHALCCLGLFLILPAVMVLTQVVGRWYKCGIKVSINMAWVFYLFWALYGVAATLSALLNMEIIAPSCNLQGHLDYFVGLSEGLGMLHCFLCPLLILGVTVHHQKADQVGNG